MTGIFLNFFEYTFKNDIFNINYLPYTYYSTKEKYSELCVSHSGFCFHRQDDLIYYWKLEKEMSDELNGKPISVSSQVNPSICSKIAESILVHQFRKLIHNYSVSKSKHSHIWEITSKQDLFNGAIEGLAIYQQIKLNTYFFRPDQKLLYGFVISAGIKHNFIWNRIDFEKHGVDVNGLKGNDDNIFANRQALEHFIAARGIKEIYDEKFQVLSSNAKEFAVIKKVFDWLSRQREHICLPGGNYFYSFSMKYLPYENNKIKVEKLSNPKRSYYEGKTNDGFKLYYNQQVQKFKPYSFELFLENSVVIGVLCPKEYEGTVEGFLNKLERVLKTDFHIPKIQFKCCFVIDTKIESYKDKMYDEQLLKSQLVIVIVTEEQKQLKPNQSPYYVCKAKYVGIGIPTQDILIDNVKGCNQFTLNNLSLNIYAKLGGTAWTLEPDEKRKDELVIGIGSTTNDSGKIVLGIAHIFHADGRYLVGDCIPLSTLDNYTNCLQAYLSEALKKILAEYKYVNTRNEFRLIFHLFKSAGEKYEIQAVTNVVEQFTQYKFQYALVHLGYGHNFRLFNNDGNESLSKGSFVRLSSQSSLLHFVQESTLPLYIQIDKRSSFKDIFYISQQAYWFTNLSHKSYIPAKRAVTILYPSLMANMTEKLKYVDGWDYERLKTVSNKLWFI